MPSTKYQQTLPLFGFLLTLLFAPDCVNGEPSAAEGDVVEVDTGVVVSAATWSLDWNTEGVVFAPEGGFSLTTDLGYEIVIHRGFHVLHGVSLAACPTAPASASWGLSIRSALAHTAEEDPSAIETLFITDLSQKPVLAEIGASAFPPIHYCRVFSLLARGMAGAFGPDGEDLSNRSVFFEGTFRRGDVAGPISIDTWWPQGKLVDLAEVIEPGIYETAKNEENAKFAFVTIRVPLGSVFDGIDFATDIEPVVVDAVVDNLAKRTDFVVDLKAP